MAEEVLFESAGFLNGVTNFFFDQLHLIGPNILGCAAFGFIAVVSSKLYTAWNAEQQKSHEMSPYWQNQTMFSSTTNQNNIENTVDSNTMSMSEQAAARKKLQDIRYDYQKYQAKITILTADIEKTEKENEDMEEEMEEREAEYEKLLADREAVDKKLAEVTLLHESQNEQKLSATTAVEQHLTQIEATLQEENKLQERILTKLEKTNSKLGGTIKAVKEEHLDVETEMSQLKSSIDAADLETSYLKEHPSDSAQVATSDNSHTEVAPSNGGPAQSISTRF